MRGCCRSLSFYILYDGNAQRYFEHDYVCRCYRKRPPYSLCEYTIKIQDGAYNVRYCTPISNDAAPKACRSFVHSCSGFRVSRHAVHVIIHNTQFFFDFILPVHRLKSISYRYQPCIVGTLFNSGLKNQVKLIIESSLFPQFCLKLNIYVIYR